MLNNSEHKLLTRNSLLTRLHIDILNLHNFYMKHIRGHSTLLSPELSTNNSSVFHIFSFVSVLAGNNV
jgi:hypothetical protein